MAEETLQMCNQVYFKGQKIERLHVQKVFISHATNAVEFHSQNRLQITQLFFALIRFEPLKQRALECLLSGQIICKNQLLFLSSTSVY